MDQTVVLVLEKRSDEGGLPHAPRPEQDQGNKIRSVEMRTRT